MTGVDIIKKLIRFLKSKIYDSSISVDDMKAIRDDLLMLNKIVDLMEYDVCILVIQWMSTKHNVVEQFWYTLNIEVTQENQKKKVNNELDNILNNPY